MKEEYRRRLPHIHPKEGVFFVTFNLADSIPKPLFEKLHAQYEFEVQSVLGKSKAKTKAMELLYESVNEILDNGKYGKDWLKKEEVANIMAESFHFLNKSTLKLICYTIMGNHVHFIAYKLNKPLKDIMHSLKSYTATECNKVLAKKGRFWQREWFDHLIKDQNELVNTIRYVLNNPVKAGIVSNWWEHKHTWCRPEFIECV